MNISKLSASSYKKWSACQQAYFIENILNYRFEAGKAANLGTITHSVLEILAKAKLAKQNNETIISTEIDKLFIDNLNIDNITEQVYNLYSNKEELKHLNWTNSDFKTIKKYVNKAISHNDGYFNPLNRKVISSEQYISLPIKESWAVLPDQTFFKITGFIDLITECNNNCLEITDYKSGNPKQDFHTGKPIDETFLFNDIQMRLYHYSCCELYGYDKTYLVTLFFLQAGPITISFAPEDAMETKERLKTRFLKIYNTKIPQLNKSYKCTRFCDYGKNQLDSAPIQFLDGQISPVGQNMCICDQVKFETDRRGLQWVVNNLKNE
jgi:hypothetical protein